MNNSFKECIHHLPARHWLLAAFPLAIILISGLFSEASAQPFPIRAVTIVSPYQAGGTSDIIARTLARRLGEIWKQPVIVENRPGANGVLGVTAVARSAPDGYTLLATASSALVLNPLLYKNLNYDIDRDLASISRTGMVPNVLVATPGLNVSSVADLIHLAKRSPKSVSYASQGLGSNGHLNGEMFNQMTGIELLHVPYRGSAPAVTDLISGQVGVMFDNLPTVLEQIRGNKLKALAVTTAQRSPALPDVPSLSESGMKDFDTSAWFGLLAPKAIPDNIRQEIERSVIVALSENKTRQELSDLGITVVAEGSDAMDRQIRKEKELMRPVIARAGIKIE